MKERCNQNEWEKSEKATQVCLRGNVAENGKEVCTVGKVRADHEQAGDTSGKIPTGKEKTKKDDCGIKVTSLEEIPVCGECLHHSRRDSCCNLDGSTKSKKGIPCRQFDRRNKKT